MSDLLLLFTHDPSLQRDLPGWLPTDVRWQIDPRLEGILQLAGELQPRWILVDLRQASSGGHSEDRWLERLRNRIPQAKISILTSEFCPEVLERRVAVDQIEHLRGQIHRDKLLSWLGRAIISTEAVPLPHEASAASSVSGDPSDEKQTLSNGAALKNNPGHVLGVTAPVTPTIVKEMPQTATSLTGVSRKFETHSPALQVMLRELEVAARHDITILLIGETGAGKTYLSRLIHEISPRRFEPFLPVACGALPADLIESELFGHTKGAFTSAHADKEGKFLSARRGSLLLDEIDVLGLEQQVKLLRVIETGEFEPVGSNETQQSQARLIVASNLELQPLVERGLFRPDLYYRLSMLKFVIPPLRQRKVDIIPMAQKFVCQFALKHRLPVETIHPDVFDHLLHYPWPGNVRELEHVIQRAVIFCSGTELEPDHLPSHVLSGEAGPTNDPSVVLPGGNAHSSGKSLGRQIALTEREIIEETLFKNSFSRTRTARDLGISRVTLYNKMKKYGLSK